MDIFIFCLGLLIGAFGGTVKAIGEEFLFTRTRHLNQRNDREAGQ